MKYQIAIIRVIDNSLIEKERISLQSRREWKDQLRHIPNGYETLAEVDTTGKVKCCFPLEEDVPVLTNYEYELVSFL